MPQSTLDHPEYGMKQPKERQENIDIVETRINATKGEAEAQHQLAMELMLGEFVQKDIHESLYWLTKAAEQGFEDSYNDLGLLWCMEDGNGPGLQKGLRWLEKAADAGYAVSQYNLSIYKLSNDSPVYDGPEGLAWLKKAVDQKYPDAIFMVATFYATGRLLKQSDSKAFKYMKKAAELDCSEAQINLSDMFAQGIGTIKNQVMAKFWRQKFRDRVEAQLREQLGSKIKIINLEDL